MQLCSFGLVVLASLLQTVEVGVRQPVVVHGAAESMCWDLVTHLYCRVT